MKDIQYIKLYKQNKNYYIKYIKNNQKYLKKIKNITPKIAITENLFNQVYYEIEQYIDNYKKGTIFNTNISIYIIKPKAPFKNYYKILKIIGRENNLLKLPIEYLLLLEIFKESPKNINTNVMNIWSLDIEVYSTKGFPFPEDAFDPVSVITIKNVNTEEIHVFYYPFNNQKYINNNKNIIIHKYNNEKEMLRDFFTFWIAKDFDIVIGWNVIDFDMKYLFNRLINLDLENEFADYINFKKDNVGNIIKFDKKSNFIKMNQSYIIDLLQIYKKYFNDRLESYKLDYVASIELEEHKLDYTDEGNLTNLYEQNLQKYIDYNIQDVELVYKLYKKFNMLNLPILIAYTTFSGFDDSLRILQIIDNLINKYLLNKNIIPPEKKYVSNSDNYNYTGGYVKHPIPKIYDWIMIFDISSSYPNQIRTFNISTDTLIKPETVYNKIKNKKDVEVLKKFINILILNGFPEDNIINNLQNTLKELSPILNKYNITAIPGGHFYKKNKYGILPEIITNLYETRLNYKQLTNKYKKLMLEAEEKVRKLEKKFNNY